MLNLGFRLAAGICVDINECDNGDVSNDIDDDGDNDATKICGAYGECVNLIGSRIWRFGFK